ncbi:MAG: hypothetical protein DWI67_05855 [Chloroflexi bacterium]|nr:MAG: hypothetical protein DWI67_05855 [Chloroflexota bacterium]
MPAAGPQKGAAARPADVMPDKEKLLAHQARLRQRQQLLDELQERQLAVQRFSLVKDRHLDAQQQREIEAQRYQIGQLQLAVEEQLGQLAVHTSSIDEQLGQMVNQQRQLDKRRVQLTKETTGGEAQPAEREGERWKRTAQRDQRK